MPRRMALQWDKLSPAEFQQLQDLAAYSSKKLEDVLQEFCAASTPTGAPKYHPDGDIDYEGFRKFLDTYLDVSTPDELSRHLYLSFVKKIQRGPDGKAFKEMAVLSSTTACAAITSHTTSSSNVNSTGLGSGAGVPPPESHSSSLADKIHGLTEKLQALGHHRTDSEASQKIRPGIPRHLVNNFYPGPTKILLFLCFFFFF